MIKGNKGEWSEIYTLLKLLADTEMYVGDEKLNRIPSIVYPILKILRDEKSSHNVYEVQKKYIDIYHGGKKYPVLINEFKKKATFLLSEIKSASAPSFDIPKIEKFLDQIKCSSLKAKSSAKTDIQIIIHDIKTSLPQNLGFSIKSQLGSASTLLNASKPTNFVYKIENCKLSRADIVRINGINTRASKVKDRVSEILKAKCKLTYSKVESGIFENNLTLIDSFLPQILAEIVLKFYTSTKSKTIDLVNEIDRSNPLKYNIKNNHKFYEYKIKRFLTDVALGMMPAKVWDGNYDATGGYLIVKENGEVLSYHIYDKKKFEDYLFYNTKLETPSTSKFDFAEIYEENREYFLKLNLQIRFLK